ncbi:DNA-directed RNA polymerase [Spizellomyces punctatus DAOM BR117]|uniref:DNA-directed RNA polymerase III subunit RPC8 n=1 Tax=Spizellomyces punctatus (strain DAOM BR117) TaxID=645134 RepID=A0A0L0HUB2_SPIPD|nr:DNA-directed RNA polymerase [Spizellomyces punctatus DAOM BR117]KND04946.1 DNA-directed RNA polymerase [Spizellomyces punctatus DAOM BR117]|eukprot:XP_016612985.1 DNA-directed RNA polymerase [Spizellomyces punctatus DAOM BR117]
MFILTLLRDNIRTHPSDFSKPRIESLTDELNKKYSNKILHNVGLCIRVWDILEASDEIVHMVQDGSSQAKVTFRMVVFRPFKGEIMTGKVASSHPTEGVRVTMDFFDDIIIPPSFLQAGSEYDEEEKVWVWKYEENDLYMDKDEPIRFRMEIEEFVDVGPVRDGVDEEKKVAPYSLVVSVAEPGLGLLSWWEG